MKTKPYFGIAGLFLLIRLFVPGHLFAAVPLAAYDDGTSAARQKVLAAAGKYQGTPYRYGGIDQRGLDCSGLVYLSFREALSVSVPRTTSALYSWAEKIEEKNLQPGDLVFFSTTGSGGVSHVGIYSGTGRFIHSASEGPQTGVMYSHLDEKYWRRTFASAGRVLPETSGVSPGAPAIAEASAVPAGAVQGTAGVSEAGGRLAPADNSAGKNAAASKGDSAQRRLLFGAGLAPSWSGPLEWNGAFRGGAAQLGLAYGVQLFGKTLLPGIELRPEWDQALGIFRMPITLSLGIDERFRVFAGPAFTVGDPVLKTPGGDRHYNGGNSWLGAIGITLAPISIEMPRGALSFYGEFAWQSYFSASGEDQNLNADFGAGMRISTGIRYMIGR
jgi:probable lipoprotein NlpC